MTEGAIAASKTVHGAATLLTGLERDAWLETALTGGTYFGRLVHHPEPHPRREPPHVWVLHDHPAAPDPSFTAVVPVFNHATTIGGRLRNLVTHAEDPMDVIVIDDGSDDETADAVVGAFSALPLERVGRVVLVRNPVPIFETACDNQGFVLARTDYVIEVQADITIDEPGYDARLLRLLSARPDVSAVSGRFVHAYDLLIGRRGWRRYPLRRFASRFVTRDSIGLIGRKVFDEEPATRPTAPYYIGETVARGPWALRRCDLQELGYLDEANFFLGCDDHDFHRRMLVASGRLPAYAPMRIWSPESDGATRRTRTGLNREVYDELARTRTWSREFTEFLDAYRPFFRSRPLRDVR